MTWVTERYAAAEAGRPVVIVDFTPPRSGDPAALDRLKGLTANFLSAAYNPGKLVRADSATVASVARERTGADVAFSLAPRDMNTIALQSRLLGAQMVGLENVIVLAGDDLAERELSLGVKSVRDLTSTAMLRSIRGMNEGVDYRGAKLQGATSFCIGATLDLAKGIESEAALAARKVEAGADFFIAQPIYDLGVRERFMERYGEMSQPVFWGLQVLDKDGLILGDVPEQTRRELEGGRPGEEIASELLARFVEAGVGGVYLVPPILKGGGRDYEAAQRVIAAL
jgi:5,10-methylenetetrahydrofolate reductase